jgi:hypothetical protein
MPTQPNRNIQRLTLHVGVGTLASALSNVFSAVFLIRVGLAPAEVFLAFAAILALRFMIRPIVLIAAPAMGLRRALIFGIVLSLTLANFKRAHRLCGTRNIGSFSTIL